MEEEEDCESVRGEGEGEEIGGKYKYINLQLTY